MATPRADAEQVLELLRSPRLRALVEEVQVEALAATLPPHLEPGGAPLLGDGKAPWSGLPPASDEGEGLLVMKFGGSSLATAEHMRRAADIVTKRIQRHPVVVLSAMGKTTNDLLAAADHAMETGTADISKIRQTHEGVLQDLGVAVPPEMTKLFEELQRILSGVGLLKEISVRTRNLVVSFGERLSVRVFAAWYNSSARGTDTNGKRCRRLEARAIDSWEAGMLTTSGGGSATSTFSQCEVERETYDRLSEFFGPLKKDYTYLPCVTGYIAKDRQGDITTLGRDGSDLTATVIGAAVTASEVQIWKDVPGVMTTDPRVVPAARPVDVLTFEEAAELTFFGAKVVHPAAVLPVWLAKVPICVLNSTVPDMPGTRIVSELTGEDQRDDRVVAMSIKHGITLVVIRSSRMLGQHGFLAHVFEVFNRFAVSVDVIATSEVTVSLTLDRGFKDVDLEGLRRELEKVAKVEMRSDLGTVTLITPRSHSSGVLRQAFQVFEEMKVDLEMVSHGASNVNVTFVMADRSVVPCANKFHDQFFGR